MGPRFRPAPEEDASQRWERRYREGRTPWDLGRPPPALLRLLDTLEGAALRVLVPGAGTGSDAVAWAAAGHDVVAVDLAPSALEGCRRRAREAAVHVRVLEADVRSLPAAWARAFDVVWEQTCFCALPPSSRRAYARAMARALDRGGLFYGLFWHHGQPGGPPWDVTECGARAAFAPWFEEVDFRPVPSLPGRAPEFLATFRRRGWR